MEESKKQLGLLYGKFIIKRTDGRDGIGDKHYGCQYFVLDITHDPFALPAIQAYAKACKKDFPELHLDLIKILTQKIGDNLLQPEPPQGDRTSHESEEAVSTVTEVLDMIATDMKNDAKNFDGKPFNGRTVAEYLGHQGAAIATLAKIIKAHLESENP
jgi:hypothetical protein